MKIKWSTNVNAPCAGQILQLHKNGKPTGRSVLVQTDWDYPSVAQSFGWNPANVQVQNSGYYGLARCEHAGTDGTVRCPDCGLSPTAFISAAYEWLRAHDGATAEDPGYFLGGR